MIYSLRGNLIYKDSGTAVIECGGVGYKCAITFNTAKELPAENSEVRLYTCMNVREDAIELMGFASEQELECFKMLTSVSGVGVRVGIAILSELLPEQVAMAVSSGDAKTLTRASGVGNKLAQRIILELKDKLSAGFTDASNIKASGNADFIGNGNIAKAIAALTVLGYSAPEVTPVLSGFDSNLSVEELIRLTLREFGKK